MIDFMRVLDAQMNVNRYQQESVNLQAELGQALAELEMLTGMPLVPGEAP
jgi:outer membrane protein TolC